MTIDPRIQDEPHEKPQMPSRLARIVERASYRDICLFTLAVWIASAVLLDIAPQGHGIIHSNNSDPSFLDALYFVIVTLSSLGYGDYTPVGFGRVVAGCLVLYGLGAVALFIGKLASERAQAMVLLLHTSDRDRRLRGFEREIIDANQSIQDAVAASNKQLLISTLRGLTGLLEGVSNYIAFHGHHSSLWRLGNAPALNGLLASLVDLARPIADATMLRTTDLETERRLTGVLTRIESLVSLVVMMQSRPIPSDITGGVLLKLRRKEPKLAASRTQQRFQKSLALVIDARRKKASSVLTEAVLSRVLEQCPSGPFSSWPKDQNRQIANTLGVGRGLATHAVLELRKRGWLPK